MSRAQAGFLADGQRLHLQHGPIDLIVDVTGAGRQSALERAVARFETVLQELVDELDELRQPMREHIRRFDGRIAKTMQDVAQPYLPEFVTPMAAVAGAVADEIAQVISDGEGVDTAYVNNGGDVALVLGAGQFLTAGLGFDLATGKVSDLGKVTITASDPIRGMATSGWRGRSLSRGIADTVTVLASSAAQADVAATMIANHVDLAGHPEIMRRAASDVCADSDLGAMQVTVAVGELSDGETHTALSQGQAFGQNCLTRGLIHAAILVLNGSCCTVGQLSIANLVAQEKLKISKDKRHA